MKIIKVLKIAQKIAQNIDQIIDLVDESISLEQVRSKLIQENIPFKEIQLNKEKLIKVVVSNISYIIDETSIREAKDFVWRLSDNELYSYSSRGDFNEIFWKNICTQYSDYNELFHATSKENLEEIKENGLETGNKSRAISNRSTGSAIFASTDQYSIDSYGDLIIKINMCLMKKDGYIPRVSLEEPIEEALMREEIARKLGIEDFNAISQYDSEGIFESTVVIYGDIPLKYLSFYSTTGN